MTVFKPKRGVTYRYDFDYQGRRYFGSTGQIRRRDAEDWERQEKIRLRRDLGNLPKRAEDTPRFQDWAKIHYAEVSTHLERPEKVKELIRMILRFWGARPTDPSLVDATAPYHDRRLADPILDPALIDAFEAWMTHRGIAGSTKNHYRTTLSGFYRTALKPKYRKVSGVRTNPFLGVDRDANVRRTVTISLADLRTWIEHVPPHAKLALVIGILAPKLRLRNILELRWDEHFDRDLEFITVAKHKTARKVQRPLVVAVSAPLRKLLRELRKRSTGAYVITYRGNPVKSIRDGIRQGAEQAGLVYGRDRDQGMTFHTLRHTASTAFARLKVDPLNHQHAMGHTDFETTLWYTHLLPRDELPAQNKLAKAFPVTDLIEAGPRPGKVAPELFPQPRKLRFP